MQQQYHSQLKSSKQTHIQQKQEQKQQLGLGQDYEISKLGVNFGTNFEGDGQIFLKLNCQIFVQQAEQQIQLLKDSYESAFQEEHSSQQQQQLDFANSIVLKLITLSELHTQQIINVLHKLFNFPKNQDLSSLFGKKGIPLAGLLIMFKEYGHVNIGIHKQNKRCVLIHFIGNEIFQESVIDPIQLLIETGLGNISTEKNEIEIFMSSNSTFKDILNRMKNGMTLGASLLTSLKLYFKFILQKEIVQKLRSVFDQIDPDFNQSPPMQILQLFKEIDIDYCFDSLDELPDDIKFQIFENEKKSKFYKINFNDQNTQMNLHEGEVSRILLEGLASNFEIFITIPQLVAIKLEGSMPHISDLLQQIGGRIFQD